tara:strand:- start:3767 stop:4600 length:834 start_codon:yes stop_codon:yes gene_type:complete
MDNKTAKNKLRELRDSLSKVLGENSNSSSEDIAGQSKELIAEARSASKQLKKSFIEKIKDLPVVQKVSELGTAGSVAVSTAAVAQTGVAVDQTEVFVASVANDVVEQRIEVPKFLDIVVDFHVLNNWGQVVMAEKIEAAQDFVEVAVTKVEVSESQPISESSSVESDSTPKSSSSSTDNSSDTPSESESQESEVETESTEQEVEESKTSEESKEGDSEAKSEDTQEQSQEQETEIEQDSQESNKSSSQPTESSEPVKTSVEQPVSEIKPHSLISPVQ